MAHIEPRDRGSLAQLEPVLGASEAMMGFLPNSMLTMSHMPQLTMAFSILAGTVFGRDLKETLSAYVDSIPDDPAAAEALAPELVQLIAYTTSLAAGCRYCQAHTSHNALRFGLAEEKLGAILDYEHAAVFSDAERAIIGLALAAGRVPNEAEAAHFDALRGHFSDRQITQIVAVIALFGFLNRWNDTMATELEPHPLSEAQSNLGKLGWQVGKHG